MEINVQENKERFVELFNTHIKREGAQSLLEYLEGSDFFTAPASSKYHLSVPGGLCQHSLNVYNRLVALCAENASDKFSPTLETVAIVSLLHDLCKTSMYVPVKKSRKTGEVYPNGKPVWEDYDAYDIEDKLPYGHGEKSVYMLCGFLKLSREEAMAIRWHMGPWSEDDKRTLGDALEMYPLALLNHLADMEASYLDERD